MAQQLDPNCGEHFAVWGGYVYFQAGSKGLYRERRPLPGAVRWQRQSAAIG